MTISINISRKTLVIPLTVFLLLFGVVNVFASHEAGFVHVCFKDNGQIKIANQASDCKEDETASTLVTEEAYLALLARVDQLEADLNTEVAARQQADTALRDQADSIQATTDDLTSRLVHFSREGDQVFITGANLHVLNGSGTTGGTPNSLGNLIIGYNELRNTPISINDRSGSHMLVVGQENNYSSYGGIVVGHHNSTSGGYASVSGGWANVASGAYASVSGGTLNVASGTWASVSGGVLNEASESWTSVSGGHNRHATDSYDWAAGSLYETE